MKRFRANAANIPVAAEKDHDYVVFKEVRIPMRDGAELSAFIFFPSVDGKVDFNKKYPVIMNRTSYIEVFPELTTMPPLMHYMATDLGYAYAVCGVRATTTSDGGALLPMQNEGWGEHQDGVDTMAWLLKQPWCNGHVSTTGMSYLGGTQYVLQLMGDVPGLETSAIHVPSVNSFDGGWIYTGDFVDMCCLPMWVITILADQLKNDHLPADVVAAIMKDNELLGNPLGDPTVLPGLNFAKLSSEYGLIGIPIIRNVPFFREYLEHRHDSSYFSYNNVRNRKHDMKKPVLFTAGWFDLFGNNSIEGYEHSVKDAPSEEVARGHRLIVGPWTHSIPLPQYPCGLSDFRVMNMEWIRYRTEGVASDFFENVPVAIYVLGENRWRAEQHWPLPDAEPQVLFLHSDGSANSTAGNGVLTADEPAADESPDTYQADPANPVVNMGGVGMLGGQVDQSDVEKREDVLVYTGPELSRDTEVTGSIRVVLHAATSGTDTDFFARVVDVAPDGSTLNIATGGRRGRYVENGRDNPTALEPGKVYRYEIVLKPTSYVFKAGHRIRLDVCSSDAAYFDVNPNAFVDLNTATTADYVVATQTLHHDAEHASYVELPVIPQERKREWIEWPFDVHLIDGAVEKFSSTVVAPPCPKPLVKDASELPCV
ncbi:MAG: CocE/NonD family hydrolase [Eggerthellaceae bacterium]|nr:CocE/NonD family hydrolase [Eggerthellaceae bacterium]